MFARIKKSGKYQYLQIVENRKENGKVKQRVISTIGRMDQLQSKGRIETLIRSLSRFSERTLMILNGQSDVSAEARKIGAMTIYLCCNPVESLPVKVDVLINPVLGPEVVTGSTRMKAGTATKLILNMITTTAMVRLGKTFGNRMVDLEARSEKLTERSKRILMEVTGVSYREAGKYLLLSRRNVKTAIVMILREVDFSTAHRLLREANGFVWKALK